MSADILTFVAQVQDNTRPEEVSSPEEVFNRMGSSEAKKLKELRRPVKVDVVAVQDNEIPGNLMLLNSFTLIS